MKTPLTYYGGKQQLASTILRLIPEHDIYCEPFVGGGAIFFSKEPSKVEVINDINNELMNFYQVVQQNYPVLEQEIKISLHSRDLHRRATVIYNNPDMFDPIKRAWAVWMLSCQSYGSMFDGGFGYDRTGTTTAKITNKRESFTLEYAIRLQNVQIECADALRIIRSRDTGKTFFYCDPPYYNSDCGHYDGYTIEDFGMLLESLAKIEGKFLLSSYPSPILSEYLVKLGWDNIQLEKTLSMSCSSGSVKKKTEVLTANYGIRSLLGLAEK